MAIEVLANLLARFVMQARRQDETPYPPATLMQLDAGIQRHFRENGQPSLAILVIRTLALHGLVVTKEGVGTETEQAQPLTPEQEEKLWSLGIFSLCTGWGLTNIVF